MREFSDITDTLNEAWEYFDNLSDIDGDLSPNRELRLAMGVQQAIGAAAEREMLLEEAAVILRDLVDLALSAETEIHGLTGTAPVDCECVGCGTRYFLAKLEARDA